MKCQTITETYDWRNKGITTETKMPIPMGTWNIELDRNSADGSFNIKVDDPFGFNHHTFTENNKSIDIANEDRLGFYNVHSSLIDSTSLEKTKSLGITENYGVDNSFIDFALFPKNHPINKNIILKENEYLLLRTINTVNFKISKSILYGTQYFTDIKPEITYTNTYVVPKKLDALNPSEDLFDIYVKNDSEDEKNTVGDTSYQDGTMNTSATGTTKFKLNTISNKDEKDKFEGAPKVSTIKVFDITNYNYEKKKVETGYGSDSRKGVIVPYDFKGQYQRSFKISPNFPFRDLNVILSNLIKEPTLDPYEGDVILTIDDIENKTDDSGMYKNKNDTNKINWKIISSENFERLKDIDPSLVGLGRLANEDNL